VLGGGGGKLAFSSCIMVHAGSTAEQPVRTEVQSTHMQELIRKVKVLCSLFKAKLCFFFSSNKYITVKMRTGLCQYMHLECNQLCGCSTYTVSAQEYINAGLYSHIHLYMYSTYMYIQYIYVYIYLHLKPTVHACMCKLGP
jgi:hypothetical protein